MKCGRTRVRSFICDKDTQECKRRRKEAWGSGDRVVCRPNGLASDGIWEGRTAEVNPGLHLCKHGGHSQMGVA